MPPASLPPNARTTSEPGRISLRPTTSPKSLIDEAELLDPPRVPRFCIPFPASQRNARDSPVGSSAEPTTTELSLMPLQKLCLPPSVPRFRARNWRVAADTAAGVAAGALSDGRVGSLQAAKPAAIM